MRIGGKKLFITLETKPLACWFCITSSYLLVVGCVADSDSDRTDIFTVTDNR